MGEQRFDELATAVARRRQEATTERGCPVCQRWALRPGEYRDEDGHVVTCPVRPAGGPVDDLAGRLTRLVKDEIDGATGPAVPPEVKREALRRVARQIEAEARWIPNPTGA